MCDEWMTRLDLALTPEQFQRLPRHPAFRYFYADGELRINPSPRYYHAMLDLTLPRDEPPADVILQPVRAADWEWMHGLFVAAFEKEQPFCGQGEEARHEAARQCLRQTREHGDGPLIDSASWSAWVEHRPVGVVLPTLLPLMDPTLRDAYYWLEEPPTDCIPRRLGRPHLTWIFVAPDLARTSIGTTLLDAAARSLVELGFHELSSTFLLGNNSSLLWHWRNGFQLLCHPGSRRKLS